MRIEDEGNQNRDRMQVIRPAQEHEARERARVQEQAQKLEDYAARLEAERRAAADPGPVEQEKNVHAQAQNREVSAVNEYRQLSGQERSDEAVESANRQEDRGQHWQAFSKVDETEIPPSIEELNADKADEARREEQQRLNLGDLLNQMKIRDGKIGA